MKYQVILAQRYIAWEYRNRCFFCTGKHADQEHGLWHTERLNPVTPSIQPHCPADVALELTIAASQSPILRPTTKAGALKVSSKLPECKSQCQMELHPYILPKIHPIPCPEQENGSGSSLAGHQVQPSHFDQNVFKAEEKLIECEQSLDKKPGFTAVDYNTCEHLESLSCSEIG